MPNQFVSGLTGRRGYYRFLYGTHYWSPIVEGDWSRGMIRDAPRTTIPANAVYDAANFLLHQPGVAIKRGGSTYAGPGCTAANYLTGMLYAEFPAGAQVLAIGENGHLYKVTSGSTSDISTLGSAYTSICSPKLHLAGTDLVVIPGNDGKTVPKKYDGTTVAILGANSVTNHATYTLPVSTLTIAVDVSSNGFPDVGSIWVNSSNGPQQLAYTGNTGDDFTGVTGGTGTVPNGTVVSTVPPGRFTEIYKSRLVIANVKNFENRVFFSPTPDIEVVTDGAGWDSAESYIDADHAVTGLASLQNVLIVFSNGHTERIAGSTPPPGTDMDRAPVGGVGCTDSRSIVVQDGNAIFANPKGVYLTNGASFICLTNEGGIETYWQSLFVNYDPATWIISAGLLRSFLVVTVLDDTGTVVTGLMCNIPKRAWWRITNTKPSMFSQAVGVQDELYYADHSSNKVVKTGTFFTPSSAVKNDANGSPVVPSIEFRANGDATSEKRFGFGRVTLDMRDSASDAPEMEVTIKTGVEALVASVVPESPLAATTATARKRFSIARESQAVTVLLSQSNASAKTEIYSLEIDQRGTPLASLDNPA